nr:MAG TPA: hypothetical protein [Caudoviricetes sp.]
MKIRKNKEIKDQAKKKKLDYLINMETRLKRGEIKWLQ